MTDPSRQLAQLAVARLLELTPAERARAARALGDTARKLAKAPPTWLVLGGVAVGFGAALLVAPERGAELRARLRQLGEHTAERVDRARRRWRRTR